MELIEEARQGGARLQAACEVVGLSPRSVQRWAGESGGGEDGRHGPKTAPGNRLSTLEKKRVVQVANSPQYRDLSPKQIVPKLADRGEYVGSESTFYRVLREHDQVHHRERSAAPNRHRPRELVATGPCQVWSWDITYLKSNVAGMFFYLYLVMDVWSRKIVGYQVHAGESSELAAQLLQQACEDNAVGRDDVTLHSDNGSPMKGATMLATLQRLGVMASFSRPHVSDDNPYSEALFRTLKYRPQYPSKPFESLQQARAWAGWFVRWYNTEHQHSAIRFVTPEERHSGRQEAVLKQRQRVYEQARRRHPERWTGASRDWEPVGTVVLNPAATPQAATQARQAA